jgi:hypothetical protein
LIQRFSSIIFDGLLKDFLLGNFWITHSFSTIVCASRLRNTLKHQSHGKRK